MPLRWTCRYGGHAAMADVPLWGRCRYGGHTPEIVHISLRWTDGYGGHTTIEIGPPLLRRTCRYGGHAASADVPLARIHRLGGHTAPRADLPLGRTCR